MDGVSDDDLEQMLAERGWLERLARRLVSDPGRAEDLAQETLLRAIRARRPAKRWGRSWLAAVLRNRYDGYAANTRPLERWSCG